MMQIIHEVYPERNGLIFSATESGNNSGKFSLYPRYGTNNFSLNH